MPNAGNLYPMGMPGYSGGTVTSPKHETMFLSYIDQTIYTLQTCMILLFSHLWTQSIPVMRLCQEAGLLDEALLVSPTPLVMRVAPAGQHDLEGDGHPIPLGSQDPREPAYICNSSIQRIIIITDVSRNIEEFASR